MNRYRIELDPASVSDIRATYAVYDEEVGQQLHQVTVLNGGDHISQMDIGATGLEVYADPDRPQDVTHKLTISPPLREQAQILAVIGKFSALVAEL